MELGDLRSPDVPEGHRRSVASVVRQLLPGRGLDRRTEMSVTTEETEMIRASAASAGEHRIGLPLHHARTGAAPKGAISIKEASGSGQKDVSGRPMVAAATDASDGTMVVAADGVNDKATAEARDVRATALVMDAGPMNADRRLTNDSATTSRKSTATCASGFSQAHGRRARMPIQGENDLRLDRAGKAVANPEVEPVAIEDLDRIGEIAQRALRPKVVRAEDLAHAKASDNGTPGIRRIALQIGASDRATRDRSAARGSAAGSANARPDRDRDHRVARDRRTRAGRDAPSVATRISRRHSIRASRMRILHR